MRCIKCSALIPDDSKDCPYCLTKFENSSKVLPKIKVNVSKNAKPIVKVIVIIFGLIMLYQAVVTVVALLFMLGVALISSDIITTHEFLNLINIVLWILFLITSILFINNIVKRKIKKRKISTIIYSIITVILIALILAFNKLVKPHFPVFENEDYVIVNNIQIPTIHKFTDYDKKATALTLDAEEKNVVIYNVTLYYIENIPINYINIYKNNLIDLGYEEKYDQKENKFYIKWNIYEGHSILIGIFDNEIEYLIVPNNYLPNIFPEVYNNL